MPNIAICYDGDVIDSIVLNLFFPFPICAFFLTAATVLAVVRAAAVLELPVAVTGLLCLAENMPSGSATRPGDVIVCGTPTGAGARFDPPIWLKPGDVIEVEAEGIGILRNTVRDE